ncbi:MAG: hypothetical protein JO085_07275 [Acidimicrobiia bacterium]|nr:hypothetical protein [Acidimicrobiia bacterium]
MKRTRKALIGAAMAGATLVGGGIGAAIFGPHGASAQTSTTTPAQSSTPPQGAPGQGAQPSGKFVSNEDPTHEAGESAQREAQENAGQFPTVP